MVVDLCLFVLSVYANVVVSSWVFCCLYLYGVIVLNIGRYVVRICFVVLLSLGLRGGVVFAQPACLLIYNDPVGGVNNVPVNHQVTVYYQSYIPNICKSMVEMETYPGGDMVPLRIVSSREWNGVVGGRHVIWGRVVVQPKDGFIYGEGYSVIFDGKGVSNFRVSTSNYSARGHFISSRDLFLNFKNFPNVSVVTPDLVNNMFEDIVTGLIASRKNYLPDGDSKFFSNYIDDITNLKSSSAGDGSRLSDYNVMGELADIFYNFDSYQKLVSYRYGGSFGDQIIWQGLIYYLRRQFPRLFSPDAMYPVKLKKIVYSSVSPNGRPVKLSSVLIYPEGNISSHPYLVSIHHPTMPSNSAQTDGDTIDVFLGVLLASRGNVVVMSDLLGHGVTSGEMEPYLISLPVNYEYLDALEAAEQYFRENFGYDIAKLPLALVGFSQGAHDAMEFSRFMGEHGRHKLSHLMALSGPYDVHSTIMGAACVVSGSRRCSGGYAKSYIGYEGGIHQFAYKIVQAAVSYRGLHEGTMRQFFDESGNVSSLAARSFYSHGDYPILHNIAAMGSLPGSDERFNSPNLNVMLYHPEGDRIAPAQNTFDTIEFLRYPGNVLLSVKKGDCREGSLLSKFVRSFWVRFKGDILASHVVCLPYFFNDVLVELG
ncbi:putative membrane protein [Candidatus Ichthyocystis hellenicum]|uniref:Putative membrane protein n=1 Tax=Candidatus Ichthyocystis hellenicum TaxID=1561003 RepID=A0A0S4LZY5_9BURK|nr:putative membrane protein [Candidatus Ichthyocystis hellenicum]